MVIGGTCTIANQYRVAGIEHLEPIILHPEKLSAIEIKADAGLSHHGDTDEKNERTKDYTFHNRQIFDVRNVGGSSRSLVKDA